jgi:hypothetical protein
MTFDKEIDQAADDAEFSSVVRFRILFGVITRLKQKPSVTLQDLNRLQVSVLRLQSLLGLLNQDIIQARHRVAPNSTQPLYFPESALPPDGWECPYCHLRMSAEATECAKCGGKP